MRRRLRQHINPLKASSLLLRAAPLALADGPLLEVELGCGDALFLIERARRLPDRIFIGFDIREKFLAPAREEIRRSGPSNLTLHVSNLMVDLPELFPPGRVHRFHINFPDPWFKRRQHNRRWLGPDAMPHLCAALEPGGEIFFQSDVWELALEALALFESCASLRNQAGEWRFLRRRPFSEQSARERVCLEEGRRIWRLLFARLDGDDGASQG
jgi:tRNA (guanine-N7-)-methyltransferase